MWQGINQHQPVDTITAEMFKYVAVVALLAVAAASPDPAVIAAPLAYSAGLAPAVTAYSSIYNPAPVYYSSPALAYPGNYGYAHLIKKRSAPLVSSYITSPLATAYTTPYGFNYVSAPLATTYSAPLATAYSAPIVHSPVYTTAHLIKKRAAPVILPSASYISPAAYSAPIVSTYSTYPAATPYYPYYSASPLAYTSFIKK